MKCFWCGRKPKDSIYYRVEGDYYCADCCRTYRPKEYDAWDKGE
jgi:hypothetical protein